MTTPLTVECNLDHPRSGRGNSLPPEPSRLPRVARLMALAIRMENLIRAGGIADYSGNKDHVPHRYKMRELA
jgi:hypothetical protein